MAGKLGDACRVRVQTPALKDLTDAACMPDLTVEEYGGRKCARTVGPKVVVDDVSGSDHGSQKIVLRGGGGRGLRVQTVAASNLTDAECIPGLTVKEYGG